MPCQRATCIEKREAAAKAGVISTLPLGAPIRKTKGVMIAPRVTAPEPLSDRLILENMQSVGDTLMLTAAIRDLHKAYPGKFTTDVRTPSPQIWDNNPYITRIEDGDGRKIKLGYSLIHQSNSHPYHFCEGFTKELEKILKIQIPSSGFGGEIYLDKQEKIWMSQVEETGYTGQFWVLNAGGKYDFTAKWWNPDWYQEVVDHFRGRILFVQIGDLSHWHPRIDGTLDLVGKTDLRQLIRLIYHSSGVLCPVTFTMHAAAAVPRKEGHPPRKPCVVVAGGREPSNWEAYPHHRYLSVQGALPCCDNGGCWKSRATKVNDGDKKNDPDNLCVMPVEVSPIADYPSDKIQGGRSGFRLPRCMEMITPKMVIQAIESYYDGGVLRYDE